MFIARSTTSFPYTRLMEKVTNIDKHTNTNVCTDEHKQIIAKFIPSSCFVRWGTHCLKQWRRKNNFTILKVFILPCEYTLLQKASTSFTSFPKTKFFQHIGVSGVDDAGHLWLSIRPHRHLHFLSADSLSHLGGGWPLWCILTNPIRIRLTQISP